VTVEKHPITLDVESHPNTGAVCVPNISTAERRKRLRFGLMSFGIALVILAVLMVIGADRLWRLPLILLFWGATTGYFQWRDKTCVGLARVDSRKIGDEMEKIENEAELTQVRRQARQVQIKAIIAGLPLLLIAMLLPVVG
jgi:hypothetical protein